MLFPTCTAAKSTLSPAIGAGRRGRLGRAVRCVVEAMENRVLLSAGDPDLAFGVGGIAAVGLGFGPGPETNTFQLVEMDVRGGKTIAVGNVFGTKHQLGMVAVRLNADGRPDTSFGGTGLFGYGDLEAGHVLIQPDGKTLIAVRGKVEGGVDEPYTVPMLIRVNADGGYDTTFSDNGILPLPLDIGAIDVSAAGKITLGGSYTNGGQVMVARYLADGTPDSGFGEAGQVSLENYTGEVRGMTIQSDGGVVVAGRLNYLPPPGGTEQPGGEGLVKLGGTGGTGWGATRVAFLPAGYAAGGLAPGGSDKVVVGATQGGTVRPLRYNANGTLDKTFAPLTAAAAAVSDVRTATDGKVVVFASKADDPDGGTIAVRYNADGTLDKTFAPGLGYRPTLGVQGDLQADNQVVTVDTDAAKLLAARYWYAGGPDPARIAPAADGTLTLNGTAGNDTISVFAAPLTPGGPVVWRVRVNGFYRAVTPSAVKRVVVNAGAGDDFVHLGSVNVPVTASGGDGADALVGGSAGDTLDGGAGADLLHGGDGNDTLRGGAGVDSLFGDAGNDRLDGGTGGDDLWGGAGTDTLDYGARSKGVTVGLGTFADDGEIGEGDNAHADNEIVIGGSGNDTITGTAEANTFYGNGGDDTLYGRGGNDTLVAGTGRNKLYGEDGNDTLYARNGAADLLDGGIGSDQAQRDAIDSVKNIEKFI